MDFWDDDRGQSVQVGAVLLFAVLVILLAGYQSTIVPNDNRAAEFDHSLETEQDMLDVRNAIIEAYQDGEAAPVSVKLGTTYPRHTFAVNPAPVSGTLSTRDAGNITVTADGSQVTHCPTPETKFLNYSADYNYYSPAPTLIYENTVLFADYGEDRQVVISDQSLVSGDTVNLVALQGEYSENGIGATDFQARAGGINTIASGDYNVTVPTRLSSDTWERILSQSGHDVTVVDAGDGQVEMVFTDKQIRCSAVGADGTARGGEREDGGGDGVEINPASPDDIELLTAEVQGGNTHPVEVTFHNNNENDSLNATAIRLNYYSNGDVEAADVSDITGGQDVYLARTEVSGTRESLSQPITFEADADHVLQFEFLENGNKYHNPQKDEFFVITIFFENGETRLYFVSPK